MASQGDLEKNTLEIALGDRIERSAVEQKLSELKFKEVTYVYEPGEFAVRGSLIDIFSFSSEYPYRIDFFGDEVESIRSFEVETQLSREKIGEISIVPKITGKEAVPITSFLPKSAILITKDIELVKGNIEKLRNEGFTLQAKLSETALPEMPDLMSATEVEVFARSVRHWELRNDINSTSTKVKSTPAAPKIRNEYCQPSVSAIRPARNPLAMTPT